MRSYNEIVIRSYDMQMDRARVEDFERRCEVGPSTRIILFTDTMGDPICRIRNSPMYKMLVAELGNELIGVIQGSIKLATVYLKPAHKELAKVGYVLGLRVAPQHRRRGVGSNLVCKLEEWFRANDVDYAYMATEKDNKASVRLFVDKLGYVKFRKPAILVNPVNHHSLHLSSKVKIAKLKIEDAELLYRKFMALTEFFPDDIDGILRNKLSLGTWVAYPGNESWSGLTSNQRAVPSSWAMLSVWNSGELFKLRLEKAPLSCLLYTKVMNSIDKLFPCLKFTSIPDFSNPFGFYFMYGLHREGPSSGELVKTLCRFVHNLAMEKNDCKVVVTEVGGDDQSLKLSIPHRKSISCEEDLWCVNPLKMTAEKKSLQLHELTNNPPSTSLFVDPREV